MQEYFKKYNIEIADEKLQKFEQFLEIFLETNSQINLSAIRDTDGVITKHFIDSLMLYRKKEDIFFSGATFLDIGTGGGFPTIPLAIMNPECVFYALDTRRKKIGCIMEFCKKLGLKNVIGVWGRAEDASSWEKVFGERKIPPYFDTIITRATAHLSMLADWSSPLLDDDGILCVYKTPSSEEMKEGSISLKNNKLKIIEDIEYSLEGEERKIFIIR